MLVARLGTHAYRNAFYLLKELPLLPLFLLLLLPLLLLLLLPLLLLHTLPCGPPSSLLCLVLRGRKGGAPPCLWPVCSR